MADVPLRTRKRDKFRQKLGLQRSPVAGASNVGRTISDSSDSAVPNSTTSQVPTSTVISSVGHTNPTPPGCASDAVASITELPDAASLGTSSSTRDVAEEAADLPPLTSNLHSPTSASPGPICDIESNPVTASLSEGTPLRRDLWREAVEKLSIEDQQAIKQLQPEEATEKPMSETIQELLSLTTTVRDECQEKRFRFRFRGHDIILRDVVGKTIFWLNKFKEIGDVAVNFDPVHASLPWAGLRFLLQAC